ncbi:hypothetical protein GCM10027169_31360 [Gordonia jinhuaensis]|uniref:Flavodoxin-like domain-containing protein n=1 Tax=Gordonia jinhuaensis TaxID=1517702 RepID=A0A916T6J5_9ACTN|nr:flavodoxin domain-containing protein [Gordonia jinhuaensis]GGB33583.1 hypothetical protein GCM10011489_22160 [Gordonia jinhuaensis]
MSVMILFGTETGTAENVAEEMADVVMADGVYDMTDFDIDDLAEVSLLIVVCSTYGSGELPTGAEPFAAALDARTPDLSHLRFAVFGLGDVVYEDTYNRGGEIMAEILTERGATQVGEHGRHDGSSDIKPRVAGRAWAQDLTELLEATA